MESENLGELFSGDRIENSVYKVESKVNKACEVACRRKLTKDQKKAFERAIEDDYQVHWILDSLPVGMYSQQPKAEKDSAINRPSFSRGFPVGFKTTSGTKSKYYLNNHIRIIIQYHDDFESFSPEDVTTKVVGFVAEPMSIRHNFADKTVTSCPTSMSDSKDLKGANGLDKSEVVFTYEVIWQQSDTEWSNRWDLYLTVTNPEEKVHWFSITNAILVILLLTALLAIILVRALYRDIAKYNESDDESGWKLVHADVFRPPADFPMLFCVFVGTGFQLGLMSLATLSFALLGLLSPANRGSLGTAFILLFVFMGSFAGFYSSSTYKMFRGADWKQITLVTAFLFPGIVFTVFFGLNIVMWAEGSSAALPFSTFFTLLFLWFCVSVPLVFVGSFVGFKKVFIHLLFVYSFYLFYLF
jgi:transmembrane 9 superfamily protein 2/4